MTKRSRLSRWVTGGYFLTGPVAILAIFIAGGVSPGDIPEGLTRAFTAELILTDVGRWIGYQSTALALIILGIILSHRQQETQKGRKIVMAGVFFGLSPLAIVVFGMEYLVSPRLFKLGLLGAGFSTVIFLSIILGSLVHRRTLCVLNSRSPEKTT